MNAPYKYNSSWNTQDLFTNYYTKTEVDALIAAIGIQILTVAPTPVEGLMYINSSNDNLYIYYGGTWQILHTLTPAAPPTPGGAGEPMGLLLAITYS